MHYRLCIIFHRCRVVHHLQVWKSRGGVGYLVSKTSIHFLLLFSRGKSPFICAIGAGILFCATQFSVLAPLPPDLHTYAITFYMFLRLFGTAFGTVIGAAILNSQLRTRLPPSVYEMVRNTPSLSLAVIPSIKTL